MSDLEEVKLLDSFLKDGRPFREKGELVFSPISQKQTLMNFGYKITFIPCGKLVNKSKLLPFILWTVLGKFIGLFGPL